MQSLYRILKTALWCSIGVFTGASLYCIYDYIQNKEAYEYSSAPWYTSIQISGIFTVIVAAILVTAMLIIRKKME